MESTGLTWPSAGVVAISTCAKVALPSPRPSSGAVRSHRLAHAAPRTAAEEGISANTVSLEDDGGSARVCRRTATTHLGDGEGDVSSSDG